MKLVSFNAFRTLRLPGVTYIKPEQFSRRLDTLREADWLLFPEYWQLGTLIFGLQRPIFPSPASYFLGHDKIEMTRAFSALEPAHVPFTLIEPNTREAAERIWEAMTLPFVAKIPRSSQGDGVFLIQSRGDWARYCASSPVLYAQEYLPIDRDLRIVLVGNEVLGGYWRVQAEGGFHNGFHNNVAKGGTVVHGPIPEAALALVQRLATTFGIDHAGFDIACVGDHPYVLEFNRLFGNQGLGELNEKLPQVMLDYLRRQREQNDPDNPVTPKPTTPGRLWRRAS